MKTLPLMSLCAVLSASPMLLAEEMAKPVVPEVVKADKVLAVVNTQNIMQVEFDDYSRVRSKMGNVMPDPETLLEELIRRELLHQAALKEGLDKDKNILKRLATFRYNLLSESMQISYLSKNPITDAQLQAEYDDVLKNAERPQEYNARHILVETEEEAKDIIVKLSKGADFAELAKVSKDTASKDKGGEVDWFLLEQMVKPFADAIKTMKVGELSSTPIKTQYGFHAIEFIAKREVDVPSLETVSNELTTRLQNKMLVEYMKKLKTDAKIEIKEDLGVFSK